jgi:hypothetical protein
MHSDPLNPNVPAEDALPPSWLEALRTLPSENGGPSRETDAAIMANARETLAAIRRSKLRQRLWPVLAAAACLILALTLFSRPRITPPSQATAPAEDKYALILRVIWDEQDPGLIVWRPGTAAGALEVRAPRWRISPAALATDQGLIRFLDLFSEPPRNP